MKPTFDEWFAARNSGWTFERIWMQPGMPIAHAMLMLSREMRAYVTEMAK